MAIPIRDSEYPRYQAMRQEELDEKNVGKCRWCGRFFIRSHGNEAFCCDDCRKAKNQADKLRHQHKKNGSVPRKKLYDRKTVEEAIPEYITNLDDIVDNTDKYVYLYKHQNKIIQRQPTIKEKQNQLLKEELGKFKFKNKDMTFGDFTIYEEG